MAPEQLWLVVEDDDDRAFYERILADWQAQGVTYQIQGVQVLAGDGGGKTKMIGFYRYLRGRKRLRSVLGNRATIVGFLFDKDLDDIEGKRLRSSHVVYTDGYCIENHLFESGDLSIAALQLPGSNNSVAQHMKLKSNREWMSHWASIIVEWVTLCCLIRRRRISMKNFGEERPPIYTGIQLQKDAAIHEGICRSAAVKLGISDNEFVRLLDKTRRSIESMINLGRHDSRFNGKWYFSLLLREVNIFCGSTLKLDASVRTTIRISLLSTLKRSDWSARLFQHLDELIKML